MGKLIDLTGKQFGQWSVKSYVGGRYCYWLCVCTCGTECSVPAGNLRSGMSSGCGCLQWQKAQRTARARGTVGYKQFPQSNSSRALCAERGAVTKRAKKQPVSLAPVRLPE